MIVHQNKEGWEVIYQATHGLLAGKIALALAIDLRPKCWLETLTAIIEHDDHQLHFDEKMYLNDVGMPIDFTNENTSELKVLERAKRVYRKAEIKSQFTAMLVSMHLDFIYDSMTSSKMVTYLKLLKEKRKNIRKLYDVSKEEVARIYQLLKFCDRCSLILCKDTLPAVGRSLEINTSIGNETYYIHRTQNGKVTVTPWPFEKEEFQVASEFILLKEAQFASNSALEKALKNTEAKIKKWNFVKA